MHAYLFYVEYELDFQSNVFMTHDYTRCQMRIDKEMSALCATPKTVRSACLQRNCLRCNFSSSNARILGACQHFAQATQKSWRNRASLCFHFRLLSCHKKKVESASALAELPIMFQIKDKTFFFLRLLYLERCRSTCACRRDTARAMLIAIAAWLTLSL